MCAGPTHLFVKGESPLYKFDLFGDKEAEFALRAPGAWVIDGSGFTALLAGVSTLAWKPMQPRPCAF